MRSKETGFYKKVPENQKNQLLSFRSTHPCRSRTLDEHQWEYISCGQGTETVLFIPGSWHVADIWFHTIRAFEDAYRIISPTYPGVTTMAELVEGVAEILASEGIDRAIFVGHSFGGMIAQCFVRKYPERVVDLVLSNTDFPHAPKERKRKVRLSYLLPGRLYLNVLKKKYITLIEPIPPTERAFWQAYFDELYASRITKREFTAFLNCSVDYHKNYSFVPGDLNDWPGRMLLLESDNDQYFSLPQREALKAIYPQALVHTFHNGGHTPSIAQREEYHTVLRNFLTGSV
jgi:pimeloyl-ACP methyl ester carboxylesterase